MLATQMQNVVSSARAARVSRAASSSNARPVAFARVARKAFLSVNASVAVATPTAVPTAQQPLAIYVGVPSVAPTAVPSTGAPEPSLPTPQEKAEIAAAFDRWNAALQTGNPEEVAKLYSADAILLPTVSNQVRTDHVSKVDYFTAFLQIKPYGTIDEAYIRFLHPSKDIAANSGIYTFRIVKDGKEQAVTARYSFIYRKVQGEWKIIEHHSSAMPEPTGEAEVAALFDTWNAALQTGDADKVADLYAEDAVLLPTVSNQVRTTRAERVDYFKNFLQIKPFGTINQSHIRFMSPTIAANSGVYTFQVTRDGETSEVTARYSFVYRKTKGQWAIIEHHSSAMPEPMPVKPVQAVQTGTITIEEPVAVSVSA